MKAVGHQARRGHRHEPADRRDPRDGQPADLRQQPVRPRASATRTTRSSSTNPDKPLAQPRDPGALPARLDLQARGRHRRASPTSKITPARRRSRRRPYLTLGGDAVLRLEPPRLRGRATSTAASATRATRSSSRWPASSASTASATGPSSTASAQPTGIDLPGEVSGIVPTNAVEAGRARRADLPRRDLPGRHRPGLRRRHADPADQRLCGARQRRHALPAADRARHRRARRQRSSGRSSRSSSAS